LRYSGAKVPLDAPVQGDNRAVDNLLMPVFQSDTPSTILAQNLH
jgi:hypothetical protein